jgi:hypothetical protein
MVRFVILTAALFFRPLAVPVVISQTRTELTQGGRLSYLGALCRRGTVWVIDAVRSGEAMLATIYLTPDRTGPGIRRGMLALVSKGRSGSLPVPRPWIITEQTGAQDRIMRRSSFEGRDAHDVRDAADENRPFKVTGDFSDQDLVGLVRFVRTARIGSGPILRISRETGPALRGSDAARLDIMMRGLGLL